MKSKCIKKYNYNWNTFQTFLKPDAGKTNNYHEQSFYIKSLFYPAFAFLVETLKS